MLSRATGADPVPGKPETAALVGLGLTRAAGAVTLGSAGVVIACPEMKVFVLATLDPSICGVAVVLSTVADAI